MTKTRLEAFSDALIAIIITIMVLEIKVPHGIDLASLAPKLPVFMSYVLSFVFLGIYWNNHHHLFQAAHRVDGRVLWANQHLLFWLSLIPFVTGWMGENHFASLTVAFYGVVMFCAAIAYFILTRTLLSLHGPDSTLGKAIGSDRKGRLSLLIYALAIPLAFVIPAISLTLFVIVAIMWLVPDKRIEKTLQNH